MSVRKALAGLLALVMVFSLLPSQTKAASSETAFVDPTSAKVDIAFGRQGQPDNDHKYINWEYKTEKGQYDVWVKDTYFPAGTNGALSTTFGPVLHVKNASGYPYAIVSYDKEPIDVSYKQTSEINYRVGNRITAYNKANSSKYVFTTQMSRFVESGNENTNQLALAKYPMNVRLFASVPENSTTEPYMAPGKDVDFAIAVGPQDGTDQFNLRWNDEETKYIRVHCYLQLMLTKLEISSGEIDFQLDKPLTWESEVYSVNLGGAETVTVDCEGRWGDKNTITFLDQDNDSGSPITPENRIKNKATFNVTDLPEKNGTRYICIKVSYSNEEIDTVPSFYTITFQDIKPDAKLDDIDPVYLINSVYTVDKDTKPFLRVTASVDEGFTDNTLSYQWYKAESSAFAAQHQGSLIEGATDAIYYPNTDYAGLNYYWCDVRNTIDNIVSSPVHTNTTIVNVRASYPSAPVIEGKLENVEVIAGQPVPYGTCTGSLLITYPDKVNNNTYADGVEVTAEWYQCKDLDDIEGTFLTEWDDSTDSRIDTSQEGVFYFYGRIITSSNGINAYAKTNIMTVTVNPVPGTEALSGKGTEDSPYLIFSLADLIIIKKLVETGNTLEGRYLKLEEDITIPANWEPIGNLKDGSNPDYISDTGATNENNGANVNPFMGTFDGGGHLLTIEAGGKALFRFVRNATIENLDIYGEDINGSALIHQMFTDYGETGIYSYTDPVWTVKIDRVKLKSGSHTSGAGFLPGTGSGANHIWITNSIIEAGVIIGSREKPGGASFVDSLNGTIDHCISYATVYGQGGLAGHKGQTMGPCKIINSVFEGILISDSFAGGIIGTGYGFTEYQMITLGTWEKTSAPNTPVVVIRNCYVAADITGRYMIGGVFGGEPVVEECWFNGAGVIADNVFVGTLTALPPKKTTNTRLDKTYVGGIVGFMRSFSASQGLQNCYYLAKDGEGNLIESGVGQVDLLLWTNENEAGTTVDIPGVANGGAKKVYSKYYGYDAVPDFAVYCDPVTETELTDNSVVTKLNASETSYKNWIQGPKYPIFNDNKPVEQTLTVEGYKDKYDVNEELDMSGAVFTLTYTNGDTKPLNAEDITFTGFDSSELGVCTVTATYGPVSTTFKVQIFLAEPEAITVSFALYGDTVHGASGETHTLADDNLTTVWIPRAEYEIDENTTVYDVFKEALTDAGLSWVNSEGVNSEGNYISSITNGDITLAEKMNGPNSGWMYTLNGIHPQNGVAEQFLTDGDCILFHYSDDGVGRDGMIGSAVQDMAMETATLTVETGKTCQFNVVFTPSLLNGNVRCEWTSSDTGIASVDKNGVVTGIAEGEATITATAGGKSATGKVTVVAGEEPVIAVESVTVSPDTLTLKVGETGTLTATVLPEDATAKDVQWSSKNTSVATVDSKGVVTGIAKGETTITATAGGKSASVTVTVEAEEPEELSYSSALKSVIQYIKEKVPNPKVATTYGEWAVFALNRGNVADDNWNDIYLKNLKTYVDENDGTLSPDEYTYTNYSRVILALTSMGVDASQFSTDKATYDLVKPLLDKNADGSYVAENQGNNGTAFALLALDSHDYLPGAEGKAARAALIASLKKNQMADGCWSISGPTPSLDVTAAAVYSLAPYYLDEAKLASLGGTVTYAEVKEMVDRALAYLSAAQSADGGFGSASPEADVWVLIALSSIGRDAATDEAFVKAGGSILDHLLLYFDKDTGGFKKNLSGNIINQMSTEQAAYGLVAYDRFKNSKNTLYDMSDVEIASLEEKANKAAAEEVEDLIDAIGEVTLESKAKIDAARAAYDALTDEQKALVGNLQTLTDAEKTYKDLAAKADQDVVDQKAAKGAQDLIDEIGKVTLNSEKAIKAARAAYDALTDTQKALVKNLATLEDAEKQLKDMQEAAEILAAVTFHLRNGSSEEITDGEEKVYTKGDEGKDLPDASREGYEFQGWFDFPTDGTKYTKVSADLPEDLYAQWKSTSSGGSSGSSETKIKVSFRLIGAEKADKKVDLGTEEYMPDYVTWIATTTYEMDEGDTVYDLWVKALREHGLSSEGAESNYVKTVYAPASLGGYALSEFTNGPRSGWMYTLNGRHPGYGLEEQEIHDGDRIIWHYVNDYAYEVPDWFDEGAWQSLGDGRYYSRWLKAPDRFGGAGGGLGEGAKSSSSGGGNGSSGSDEVTDLIPSYDGDTVWISSEVDHSEGGMAYAADAELTKDIVTKGLEKAEDKSELKLWVDIQDSNRLVLQVDSDAMKEISDAGAGLRLQCSKGVIELDAETVAELAESGRQVRMTVSYDDWNGKTKVSVGAFPPKDTDTPVTMKIELPVTKDGQALSIVNSDGSRTPIKKSAIIGDRAYAEVTGAVTLEITDIHKYWNDVKEKDWFADAVQFTVSHELMNGVDRYEFAPNAPMTRAMLVTVLYRLEDQPEITGSGDSFGDVDAKGWYAEAVAWASENGLVNGTEKGFEPNANISREQIATILYRYAKYIGLVGQDDAVSGDVSKFEDRESVSPWAQEAMAWAVEVGLFKGDDTNSLNPQGEATRAEVATLLERLIKLIVLS